MPTSLDLLKTWMAVLQRQDLYQWNSVGDEDGNWIGPQELEQWNDIQNRPPGLDDGDDDTQLDQAESLAM